MSWVRGALIRGSTPEYPTRTNPARGFCCTRAREALPNISQHASGSPAFAPLAAAGPLSAAESGIRIANHFTYRIRASEDDGIMDRYSTAALANL